MIVIALGIIGTSGKWNAPPNHSMKTANKRRDEAIAQALNLGDRFLC
jgi:hypothetical protein